MNLFELLERNTRVDPGREALRFEGTTLCYGELTRSALAFAARLHELGVREGDRVALLLANSPAFPVAFFAIQRLGAVAVALNAMNTRSEVEFVMRDCGARATVVDRDLLERVEGVSAAPCVVVGADADDVRSFERLTRTAAAAPRARLEPNSPASILYTSGTTGGAKGAVLSVANVLSNAEAAAHCYGASPSSRMLLFLPLFHCFGQNAIMNAAFACGASIVMHRRFNLDAVLASIERDRVSHFFAVPALYTRLLNEETPLRQLREVNYFFSAAAPLPNAVALRWSERVGRRIHEGYGLTETSPFATYNHWCEPRLGSVGTPIAGVSVRIADADGNVLGAETVGEIEISGPNVMLGYWNRPEATALASREGWFRTGDLGRLDADGYLYVVGRLKEMIIVSGYKVYPAEVEDALLEHPAVRDVAVFGVPNASTGEVVHARVVLREHCQVEVESLRSFCAERLAKFKIPKHIGFDRELPKSASGKVLRRVLRDEAMGAAPAV